MLSSKNVFDDDLHYESPRFLSPADHTLEDRRTAVTAGDVLLTIVGTIGRAAVVPRDAPKLTLQRSVAVIKPKHEIVASRFLMYALIEKSDKLNQQARGVAQKGIYLESLRLFQIAFPPLPEQRRIVALLDEAFAGIATAKATAEKNLRHARAAFDSAVDSIFDRLKQEAPGRPLGTIVASISTGPFGSLLHKSDYEDGGIPLVNPINIEGDRIIADSRKAVGSETAKRLARYTLLEGDVITARRGEIGRCASVTVEQAGWICGTGSFFIRPGPAIDSLFLTHLIRSGPYRTKLERLSDRATMPSIGNDDLSELIVHVPGIERQREVETKLTELGEQTRRLTALYQQKLAALDALKRSLLHDAFSGQFPRDEPAVLIEPKALAPFPAELTGIGTTDLHAGILAIAYQRHEREGKTQLFGHVKAEKIADAVERYLGISLGRSPVKDRFGPNDFNHLKKVEHRAKMTNAFDFQRVENSAYRVRKLSGFDRLAAKARAALGDRLPEVDALLDLMLPWDATAAEVFATVYAGWNNLLIDRKTPTDEEIVYESRENWHPQKMNIPRERFFKAVQFLRDHGMIPKGRGAKVEARGK